MIKSIGSAVIAAAVVGLTPMAASASVLTFDDLTGLAFFTSDYDGFKFGDNQQATNAWFHTDGSDPQYGPASGATYIGTDAALYPGQVPLQPTMPITSATDFVFNGAYFSGYDTVEYKLYLDGALVYTSGQSAQLSPTAAYFASGYSGLIDSVVVLGTQGYYALDNFTYNEIPAVSEPSDIALILLGIVGIGNALRRRQADK